VNCLAELVIPPLKAEDVLVWLGCPHNARTLHATVLKVFAATSDYLLLTQGLSASSPADEDTLATQRDILMHTLSSSEAASIDTLYNLSCWTRHWIAQELVLAKVCRFMFQTYHLPQSVVFGCTTFFAIILDDTILGPFRTLASLLKNPLFEERMSLRALPPWFHIVEFRWDSQCQDPRDKVFGAQSILDLELRIDIDYTSTVDEVFRNAAATYITYYTPDWCLTTGLWYVAKGMGLYLGSTFGRETEILAKRCKLRTILRNDT
jgi:hypothetical protein